MTQNHHKIRKLTKTSNQQQNVTFDGTFFCAIRPGNTKYNFN